MGQNEKSGKRYSAFRDEFEDIFEVEYDDKLKEHREL
jgi:hypothetical protein